MHSLDRSASSVRRSGPGRAVLGVLIAIIVALLFALMVSACGRSDVAGVGPPYPGDLAVVWQAWELVLSRYVGRESLDHDRVNRQAFRRAVEPLGLSPVGYLRRAQGSLDLLPGGVPPGLALFWRAWVLLERDVPQLPLEQLQRAAAGAVRGIAEGLGEPSAWYRAPELAAALEATDLPEGYHGVGLTPRGGGGALEVEKVTPGGPAERAGLLKGDVILEIDGALTSELSDDEKIVLLRGAPGSQVLLRVQREGALLDVVVTRGRVPVPSVAATWLDGGVLRLEVRAFTEQTGALVARELAEARARGAPGVVLDLRENGDDRVEPMLAVASLLFSGEVSLGALDGWYFVPLATDKSSGLGLPLVALVGSKTAAAAEALAAAVQDHRAGLVVGAPTAGNGVHRQRHLLSDRSVLFLPEGYWRRPSGARIEATGVVPDLLVATTPEDEDRGRDPPLEAALRSLTR